MPTDGRPNRDGGWNWSQIATSSFHRRTVSLSRRSNRLKDSRHFVVSPPVQLAPSKVFANAAPLLEEERYASRAALAEDRCHPFPAHRARLRAGFAADDGPMNSFERQRIERPNQRFQRQESHCRGNTLKIPDST